MPEILKNSSKTGDQFTAISNSKQRGACLFKASNKKLNKKFPGEFPSPQVPKNWE